MVEGADETLDTEERTVSVAPDESASTSLVIHVAELLDADVEDMPPLREVVEPEALDRLFVGGAPTVTVAFEYAGCSVTIVDGDRIRVTPSVGVE